MFKEQRATYISTNDLRFHFDRVLSAVKRGSSLTLTYRNKPLAKITPIREGEVQVSETDPLYQFSSLAEPMGKMDNKAIDQTLYGVS